MHTPIISLQNICKNYRMYQSRTDRVLDAINPFSKQKHQDFFALKDISFDISRGESVGIVGVNGSGKSTLLKILCNVVTPSSGNIMVAGNVAALLELGAGFHPDRTGLENIYFQGAIQGIPRSKVEEMLPDIIAFADIGDFINQPTKVYSSGMYVRLAFSAVVQMRPDILIIDEALAVGDVRFQRRCFQRIEDLKKDGVTFIFVSHSTEQIVTHCTRAILLSCGQLIMDDAPQLVMNRYLDMLFGRDEINIPEKALLKDDGLEKNTNSATIAEKKSHFFDMRGDTRDTYSMHPWFNKYEYRWGNGDAKIIDVAVSSSGDVQNIFSGDKVSLYIKTYFMEEVFRPIWGCTIKTRDGITVFGTNSEINKDFNFYEVVKADTLVETKISFICDLAPGEYFISLGVAKDMGCVPLDRRYDSLVLVVNGSSSFYGFSNLHMTIKVVEAHHG